MSSDEIHRGTRLAPDEAIVWRGGPSWRRLARDVFHLRGIAAYLALLMALDAFQAWQKAIPLAQALYNSVPLLVIVLFVLSNVFGLAWLTARTTSYTITGSRVILQYGIAIPATLSLPFARIQTVALAVDADQSCDISLTLKSGEHMPYLKLWPLARPWHLARPQPMLRCIPHGAVVAGLLARAVELAARTAEQGKTFEGEFATGVRAA